MSWGRHLVLVIGVTLGPLPSPHGAQMFPPRQDGGGLGSHRRVARAHPLLDGLSGTGVTDWSAELAELESRSPPGGSPRPTRSVPSSFSVRRVVSGYGVRMPKVTSRVQWQVPNGSRICYFLCEPMWVYFHRDPLAEWVVVYLPSSRASNWEVSLIQYTPIKVGGSNSEVLISLQNEVTAGRIFD